MASIAEKIGKTKMPQAGDAEAQLATTAAQNSGAGYDPAQVDFDEDRHTVQGRIRSIINEDNKINQTLRTKANQAAGSKGLLNSSMAVQAGEQAVVENAVGIATPDAQLAYDAEKTNVGLRDQASRFQAANTHDLDIIDRQTGAEQTLIGARADAERGLIGARTDAESRLLEEKAAIDEQLINAEGDIRERLLTREGEINRELTQLQADIQADRDEQLFGYEAELQELRTEGAKELTDLEMEWRNQIEGNKSATMLYMQTAESIGQILSNPDIPVDQKQQLVNKQKELLADGMEVISGISDLDLSDIPLFSGGGGGGNQQPYPWAPLPGRITGGGTPGRNTGGYSQRGPVTDGSRFDR